MRRALRSGLLVAALGSFVLAGACELFSARLPCATVDDCQAGTLCTPDGFCARAGPDGAPPDAGERRDAGAPRDAGPAGGDGGAGRDGGSSDAGLVDAGAPDAGASDAGRQDDGGAVGPDLDAGPSDAGPRPLVLYTFDEGQGDVVRDVSGAGAPLDLTIERGDAGVATWLASALHVTADVRLSSSGAADKLVAPCGESGELTLEAWVSPDNLVQVGPARVMTMSRDVGTRNFLLGQRADQWAFRVRTSTSNDNGNHVFVDGGNFVAMFSPDGTAQLARTYVAFTRAADGVARVYLDGVEVRQYQTGGVFDGWDASYRLLVANEEPDGADAFPRDWAGELHALAIWCRALPQDEIAARHADGPP